MCRCSDYCPNKIWRNSDLSLSPEVWYDGLPSRKTINVGTAEIPNRDARPGLVSMLTVPTVARRVLAANSWSSGFMVWQGDHQSAVKATSAGRSLSITNFLKLSEVRSIISPGILEMYKPIDVPSKAVIKRKWRRLILKRILKLWRYRVCGNRTKRLGIHFLITHKSRFACYLHCSCCEVTNNTRSSGGNEVTNK